MSSLFKYLDCYVVIDTHCFGCTCAGVGNTLKEAVGNIYYNNVYDNLSEEKVANIIIKNKFGICVDSLIILAENVEVEEIEQLSNFGLKILFYVGMDRKIKNKQNLN
jgi:hypothetical protein